MATKVEIIYEAEATSLKATVNEVNKANDAVAASAKESSKEVADAYKSAGKSIAAAFSGGEVKKALADQNKGFEQLNSKGKTLTGQLRALKNELSQLESSGKAGTAQFRQLTAEAARLEDQVGDTRARVANLASDTFKFDAAVQATQGLAAGFEIAQGAAALFGAESEDLQKALLKVQAATAIANGVQQIANLLLEESKIKTFALTAAQTVYSTVVGTSTGALKLFRIALAATGVGALVLGLIALVQNFDKVKEALSNAIPGFRQVADGIGFVIDKTKEFIGISDEQSGPSALDKYLKAEQRKVEASARAVERRIQLAQAEGRDTSSLEAEKEKIFLDFAQRKLTALEKNEAALRTVGVDTAELQIELETEVADRRANIQAARIEGAKAAAEAEKKRAEAEKKAAEEAEKEREALLKKRIATDRQVTESIAKSREVDLQEQLQDVAVVEEASFQAKIESLQKQKAIEVAAAEEAGQLTADIEKKYNDQIEELTIQSAAAQTNARINELKRLEIEQGSTLQRRIDIINAEADKRREDAKNSIQDEKERASAIELINAETQAAIREEQKKTRDEAVDYAFQIASEIGNSLNAIVDLQNQFSQQRIESIQEQSNQELETINKSLESEVVKENKRAALQTRTQAKIVAEQQKQARREKALNIFKATIDTAASIVKTGAQLGYPAALPFQILAGIIGAANIAAIAAQPLPKFKRGGLVGGQSHEAGGTVIEAERGEFVVNKTSAGRHRSELDALNRSSAAFRKLIDERYVRPAIFSYANKRKDGIVVNASLNSKSMEKELKGLRKDMRKQGATININGLDSRYSWQRN
jgi:hypothetical protein